MKPLNNILFLECIPKKENKRETLILCEFLKTHFNNFFVLKNVRRERQFKRWLKYYRFKYVHISAHGEYNSYIDDFYIQLPKGTIFAEDFENNTFRNRIYFISACELGKKRFIDELFVYADPYVVIAPQRDIQFIDSAMFWILLYYNHFYLKKSLTWSFNNAEKYLSKLGYKGAMQLYVKKSY